MEDGFSRGQYRAPRRDKRKARDADLLALSVLAGFVAALMLLALYS